MSVTPLNLPPYPAKLRRHNGKPEILDVLRRKFVALTPEEWVRQHFVHYLISDMGYPAALLANEMELKLGDKRMRCDTLLYNRELQPRMIIEYKAPHIELSQRVFDQISAYNLLLRVDYLMVSNGLQHYCCRMDYAHHSYHFLQAVPRYEEL